ncbi:hypothetical protein [Caballeronia insecticola]|uniref:Uncharacterized protein n=1 Tax=Caballeronia insecticola TaxID=758793 RepID=R4WK56_9BURK|nr:hypothetical protein [Caballeronia insecticola]BAN24918.1 hypothetical protein BRPE64_BCDS02570 [Caballeronia insecticola]
MHYSNSKPRVFALAACLYLVFSAVSTSARADEPLPDPRILSAAPFEFQADTGIFSHMPGDTSDMNIIKPREIAPSASESASLENRFKRRVTI